MSELERRGGSLKIEIDRIRVELAEIIGMVSRLPTVWTLVFVNVALAVTVPALVFAVARAMK
jgi:hypothetical protein